MTHEEQMARIRRKFAAQIALSEMTRQQLLDLPSPKLACDYDLPCGWAGAAIRAELGKRRGGAQ